MSEKTDEILEDIAELLEEKLTAIDWKLWEMYKMLKAQMGEPIEKSNTNSDEAEPRHIISRPKRS